MDPAEKAEYLALRDQLAHDEWVLDDAEKRHRAHPDRFDIPDEKARTTLARGQAVKLIFIGPYGGERMWVQIKRVRPHHYVGKLNNDPICIPGLKWGDEIQFEPKHVIDIQEDS